MDRFTKLFKKDSSYENLTYESLQYSWLSFSYPFCNFHLLSKPKLTGNDSSITKSEIADRVFAGLSDNVLNWIIDKTKTLVIDL